MKLEAKIQKEIIDYLSEIGYVIKVISATKSGVLDTHACINGQFYAFEIKRSSKEKATPLQEYNIEQIEKAGGHAHVVWSVEQVKEIINGSHAASNSES